MAAVGATGAELKKNMRVGKAWDFHEDEHGTIWLGERLCVPDDKELKDLILTEAHQTQYSIHPSSTKMYQDLKEKFWWASMRREIAEFVALCDVWHDSIWVVVDRLTKVAHFISVNSTYTGKKLAELYLARIMCLHGVPKKIVSDRGSQFTSKFWQKLQEELGTCLNFSTAYHPQTDSQTERVNQMLEDMLRACALDFGGAWDKSLPYAEFSYNNSYQASLQMAPFEALYGRKCRTHIFWDQTGERQLFGTEVLTEAEEKVRTIRERNLDRKATQTTAEESSLLKQGIMYTFVSLRSGEYTVSRRKASWHHASWDHTRSWNKEEKLHIS
uniref:Retrotransposon protein, putative, Ty3-gypsy subclass n=1 Tax=Oryza sativa subsp. japonica TaxID=39947 RepID=Q339Z3_ORYSJ|nr:retrotransposon protein, putative, Ty3-gypsy subclass [Oryza sativa Japonica Group]